MSTKVSKIGRASAPRKGDLKVKVRKSEAALTRMSGRLSLNHNENLVLR